MALLQLAIDLADLAADAARSEEALDTRKEAKQLLREHPEADFTVKEVAETLEEEATAAGTDEGRIV
jgi:hypothetical protein